MLTPNELCQAAGFRHEGAVNLHYGRLGALVGDELRYKPEKLSLQGRPCMTFVIASWNASMGAWVLLPEVVEALKRMGWSRQ